MGVSLLELSPSLNSSALTRSERGGARVGLRGVAGFAGGDEAESGACAFDGAELAGVEFCAQTPTVHASNATRSQLRIGLFYRPPCSQKADFQHFSHTCVARKAFRHLLAVSSSEYRLPSCSTR